MSSSNAEGEVRRRIAALYGAPAPAPEVAVNAMRQDERALAARFRERAQRAARVGRAAAAVGDGMRQLLGTDRRAAAALAAMRGGKRATLAPVPQTRPVGSRIFSGSIGATYGPPYDFQWTGNQQQGSVEFVVGTADSASGSFRVSVDAQNNNAGAGMVRAAVGNWLSAPLPGISTMNVTASAALSYDWGNEAVFSSSETAAWIGFLVESFDRQGNSIGTLIQQMNPQWDNTLNFGNSSDRGSSSGVPLQAQFQAIEGEWYTVWVWGEAYAYGNGVSAFSSGVAFADLSVSVPWFSWQNG